MALFCYFTSKIIAYPQIEHNGNVLHSPLGGVFLTTYRFWRTCWRFAIAYSVADLYNAS